MKVLVHVVDEGGRQFVGEAVLTPKSDMEAPAPNSEITTSIGVDFELPIRPFIKRYAAGMSGPKKFVLLLARMVKGTVGAGVSRAEIEKTWESMTGLMGAPFNGAYANRAKDEGWVDSPKFGQYALLQEWKRILD